MKKIVSLVIAALLLCVAAVGCAKNEGVSTDGSTSMSSLIGALGESFVMTITGPKLPGRMALQP